MRSERGTQQDSTTQPPCTQVPHYTYTQVSIVCVNTVYMVRGQNPRRTKSLAEKSPRFGQLGQNPRDFMGKWTKSPQS